MTYKHRLFSTARGLTIGLASIGLSLVAAESASAQSTTSRQDVTFAVFVPCANDGTGELVQFNVTLLLVTDGLGQVVHGNWQNATGVGLVTGDQYIGGGSPSNLIRTSDDGEFLSIFSWISAGQDGAKFTITRIGQLFEPPTRIVQVHCH